MQFIILILYPVQKITFRILLLNQFIDSFVSVTLINF